LEGAGQAKEMPAVLGEREGGNWRRKSRQVGPGGQRERGLERGWAGSAAARF
jgi:hypothetical protein